MSTLYFLIFTVVGGVLALFIAAGVSSFQHNKLPDMSSLFRWFMAGTVTSGLGSYAYLFGANGDPAALIQNLGDAMEVKKVVESLTSAAESVAGGGAVPELAVDTKKDVEVSNEITVGMPGF